MDEVLEKCFVLLKKLPECIIQNNEECSLIDKKNKIIKENLNLQSFTLMDYEKTDSLSDLYKCTECSQSFNSRSSLTCHFEDAHALRAFSCSECCMTFPCHNNLMTHSQCVHPNLKSIEKLCTTDMTDNDVIRCPVKRNPYRCQLCDRVFNHSVTLSLHYQNVHRSFQITKSITNYDLSGFPKENLNHQNSNENILNLTNKSVFTEILGDLEANYICTCIDCNSCFRFQNLLEHINLIHPDKNVYCSCGFKGNFNATLLHSYELSHLPNETRPIILGSEDGESNLIISLQFKESLQERQLSFIKKTNHNCKECFLRFRSFADLIQHINICHGEKKSLRCLYCDKFFSHEKNLLQHVLSVHNQYKAFLCLKCYRSFTRFKNLVNHLRGYHKILDPYEELERERLAYKNNLILSSSEIANSNNMIKGKSEMSTHHHRESSAKDNSNSKYLLRNSFLENVAGNVLKYLEERYNVTCSLCCHKLLFCELDSHIKIVHPDQSICCTCGFKGELSAVMIHAFNQSHLPSEAQPIILWSEITDFKFSIILKEIEGLPVSYHCFKCAKIFKNEQLRKFHFNICKLDKNIFCDICDKGFALFFHLQMHKATIHDYKCLYCDDSFNSNASLSNHILLIHKELFHQHCEINEFNYSLMENQSCNVICNEICNRVAMKEINVQQIVLTESDLYTSSSDSSFEELQLLRSKKCRKCNDVFNTSTQLKVHSRIHAGKNPHSCQHCSEMFISRNLLTKHKLKMHGKFNMNQNQAMKCKFSKSNSTTSDSSDSDECLPQSMVISKSGSDVESMFHSSYKMGISNTGHSEAKQLILTLSDLSTSSSDNEDEESSSLQCKMCDDSFLTFKQVRVHSRLHNGKRPHSCHYCMQTFISRNLLFKHRLKFHQEFLSDELYANRRKSFSSSVSSN